MHHRSYIVLNSFDLMLLITHHLVIARHDRRKYLQIKANGDVGIVVSILYN